jgi:ankyrin repeat protein
METGLTPSKRQLACITVFFLVIAPIWWFVVPNLHRNHPLYRAIIAGDTAAVQERLRQHPSELEYRFFGANATPLHLAAERGDTNLISMLLSANAEIEAKGYRNLCTPLHSAASHGQEEAVAFLLKRGANANALDRDQKTPLHYAAANDRSAAIRALAHGGGNVDAAAPVNIRPARPPTTPLIEAVTSKHADACRTLLELGAQADFIYLLNIVDRQCSDAPFASKELRNKWDTLTEILKEVESKRKTHGELQNDPRGRGSF